MNKRMTKWTDEKGTKRDNGHGGVEKNMLLEIMFLKK